MKLSEVKAALANVKETVFQLPDGSRVPAHFHVTEVGSIEKNFIDCGGTVRKESVISFQLWSASDIDHRLVPGKLIDIINLSEKELDLEDQEVEVEYQSDTIGKYGLDFDGNHFVLTTKMTNCLAPDKCGIPTEKPRIRISNLTVSQGSQDCTPGSGCC